MDKSHRNHLKNKNTEDIWTLRTNKNIVVCSKCKKYNTIYDTTLLYIICCFCGNPNYNKK